MAVKPTSEQDLDQNLNKSKAAVIVRGVPIGREPRMYWRNGACISEAGATESGRNKPEKR